MHWGQHNAIQIMRLSNGLSLALLLILFSASAASPTEILNAFPAWRIMEPSSIHRRPILLRLSLSAIKMYQIAEHQNACKAPKKQQMVKADAVATLKEMQVLTQLTMAEL